MKKKKGKKKKKKKSRISRLMRQRIRGLSDCWNTETKSRSLAKTTNGTNDWLCASFPQHLITPEKKPDQRLQIAFGKRFRTRSVPNAYQAINGNFRCWFWDPKEGKKEKAEGLALVKFKKKKGKKKIGQEKN